MYIVETNAPFMNSQLVLIFWKQGFTLHCDAMCVCLIIVCFKN